MDNWQLMYRDTPPKNGVYFVKLRSGFSTIAIWSFGEWYWLGECDYGLNKADIVSWKKV